MLDWVHGDGPLQVELPFVSTRGMDTAASAVARGTPGGPAGSVAVAGRCRDARSRPTPAWAHYASRTRRRARHRSVSTARDLLDAGPGAVPSRLLFEAASHRSRDRVDRSGAFRYTRASSSLLVESVR